MCIIIVNKRSKFTSTSNKIKYIKIKRTLKIKKNAPPIGANTTAMRGLLLYRIYRICPQFLACVISWYVPKWAIR